MRSSLVVRASDCQCTSCNGPGFDPSIRRHSEIWGAADEAVLNIVRTKRKNSPQKIFKKKKHTFILSHSWNTYIRRHSPGPLSISSSLESSVGKASLWCRAENRTRACRTASRRANNWATPHQFLVINIVDPDCIRIGIQPKMLDRIRTQWIRIRNTVYKATELYCAMVKLRKVPYLCKNNIWWRDSRMCSKSHPIVKSNVHHEIMAEHYQDWKKHSTCELSRTVPMYVYSVMVPSRYYKYQLSFSNEWSMNLKYCSK